VPRPIPALLLVVAIGAVLLIIFSGSKILSDDNKFFGEFVSHEFLSFISVVVTITLASAANIHIELNRIEEKIQKKIFINVRASLKKSAYYLVFILMASVFLVALKPVLAENDIFIHSIFNSFAIFLILFCTLTLLDITSAAFSIPSIVKDGT
jgi:hypothetical protein